MSVLFFCATLSSVAVAFLYENGPCPDVPGVSLKNADLDLRVFYEYLRYPEYDVASLGLYTEICNTYTFNLSDGTLRKKYIRLSSCGGETLISLMYRVDFYDRPEYGAFRIAQYGVGREEIVYDDLLVEPTEISNHAQQIRLEDFDVRVVLKTESEDDDRKWLVLWGCDQIKNDTNRQSLHVLCTYDCNEHLVSIKEQLELRSVFLGNVENVTQVGEGCDGRLFKNTAALDFSNTQKTCALVQLIAIWRLMPRAGRH